MYDKKRLEHIYFYKSNSLKRIIQIIFFQRHQRSIKKT